MASDTVVIGLNWVGDNVLALPTYRALHHRFRSEGGISIAAPQHIASLLASLGLFRKVIPWNGRTRDRIRVLKAGRFRRAVILPNSSANSGFPAAPKAMAWGNAVTPRSRMEGPRSKSAATIRGIRGARCRSFMSIAASYGSLLAKKGPSEGTVSRMEPRW